MAELNRKSLRQIFEDAGLEVPGKDVLGQICSLHMNSLDGMNDSIKELQTKLTNAEKERDELKANADSKDTFKVKYDALKEEFDTYKQNIADEKSKTAKENAYKKLLADAGIVEKRIASVLKVSDLDSIKLDDSGNIVDSDKLTESIKTEWADFIGTPSTQGANTSNPPSNSGSPDYDKMSDEEYYKAIAKK